MHFALFLPRRLSLGLCWLPLLLAGCASEPDVDGVRVRDAAAAPGSPAVATAVETMPPPQQPAEDQLYPGDQVDVLVWGYADLGRRVTVTADGRLPYPLTGSVPVRGRPLAAVQDSLRDGLRAYVREPVVRLSVAVPAPVNCQVLGEVQRPGTVSLPSSESTLLEALAAAGGLNENARRRVLLIREVDGRIYMQGLDYATVVGGGLAGRQMRVGRGDTIYVPSARLADAAREARRISEILSPVLSTQQITILMDSFLRALMHGNPSRTNTLVVGQ